MGDVTRVAKEAIEAPRVIRVFNAQGYESQMFDEVNEHNRRSHMKLMMTKGMSNPIVQTIARRARGRSHATDEASTAT
jgi:subfamily B ATP-binding cassette protein MsbA